jgi:hypothetical protein
MEHVTTYFENFNRFENSVEFTRRRGLFPCLATTLKIYGPQTWDLIPVGVIGSALERWRCDKDVVDLVTQNLQLFPPEVVLEIIRILHRRAGGETKPVVLVKLLQSMSPEWVGQLLRLEEGQEIRRLLV